MSLVLIWLTGIREVQAKNLPWDWVAFEAVLVVVPFAVPAIALLLDRREPEDGENFPDSTAGLAPGTTSPDPVP